MNNETIRVVLVEPGKHARIADIDASLEGMQQVVDGYIEATYPYDEEVCIVCNEEGKIRSLPLNRAIREEDTLTECSYAELRDAFREIEQDGSGEHLTGRIVFKQESFTQPYSEESRTYVVSSANKAFQPNMGGYSIFGSALDGSDPVVRLDAFMAVEHGGEKGWQIERCYLVEEGREILDIVAGTFFICDCSGENFGSLSDEQLQRYKEKFKNPEHFVRTESGIQVISYNPQKTQER